jgi:hypothetical protein
MKITDLPYRGMLGIDDGEKTEPEALNVHLLVCVDGDLIVYVDGVGGRPLTVLVGAARRGGLEHARDILDP